LSTGSKVVRSKPRGIEWLRINRLQQRMSENKIAFSNAIIL